MKPRMHHWAGPILLVTALGAAGCSQHREPDEVLNMEENQAASAVPAEANTASPVIVNQAAPANVAEAPPVADPVADEQQVQDDADASGMTARTAPSEQTAPANQSTTEK